jgi:hypothetical protein
VNFSRGAEKNREIHSLSGNRNLKQGLPKESRIVVSGQVPTGERIIDVVSRDGRDSNLSR